MGFFKNSCFTLLVFFLFIQNSKAQCNLTPNTGTDFDCLTGKCSFNIIFTPPSPPYTVVCAAAGINSVITANTVTFSNLPYQDYYFTIYYGNGCFYSGGALFPTFSPNSPNNIIVSGNVICYGSNTGSASASYVGVPPYTWSWSTGATTPSVSGLPAGNYSVTILDSKGCGATKPFTINQSTEIYSELTTTLISCYGATISSAITSTGGNNPYSYTVNGTPITSSSGNLATNVSAGLQTIFTKDVNGCVKTNTMLLGQAAQQIITPTITPPNCPGDANAVISVAVNGPVAGYTYSWHPVSSGSSIINNVPAGNYTLHVLDASNCITSSVITIPQAPSIIPMAVTKKENCSAVDGAFTLSIAGGHPPFTFTTLPGNSNSNVLTGLSSGNYTSIISDSHGCIDSTRIFVGNLSTVSMNVLTVTPVECYNNCNGSVILNVQNVVQPVTYSLTGMPLTTNSVVSNLCAGFYAVKVIDGIGCPAFDTINFAQPPVFSYSATIPPIMCIGKTALLKATALGGSGALTYIWNPGGLQGATVSVNPSSTTIYSLNVYDSKGCTLPSYSVLVSVNPQISISINNSNAGICPGTTAQITPTVSGGDGNYSYNWLPGNSSGSSIYVESITIPIYTLTVRDGCGSPSAVKEIEIRLHPVTKPSYTEQGQGGCSPYCTTFINTTPNSKNAIWNFGDKPYEQAGDTARYCYEKAGSFNLRVTVTDENFCKASFTYLNAVNVLVKPDAEFITDPVIVTLNESDNVLIKNTSVNGSSFKWYVDGIYKGAKQNINYTFQDTGCYDIRLIAENANHCIDSTTRTICVFEGFNFYMPNAFTPDNDGLNDILLPKGTGWLYDNYKFEIFNRWGRKVFFTRDVHEGWDGGAALDPFGLEVAKADINDVYVWRAVVTDNMQKEHELKGVVMLVR